jgi:hypothetical protein
VNTAVGDLPALNPQLHPAVAACNWAGSAPPSAPSVLDYWVQLVGEQRRCSQGGAALRPYGPCYDHLPEPTLPITMDGALGRIQPAFQFRL